MTKEEIQAIRNKVIAKRATREEILAVFDFAQGDTKNVHVTITPTAIEEEPAEPTAHDVLTQEASEATEEKPVESKGFLAKFF